MATFKKSNNERISLLEEMQYFSVNGYFLFTNISTFVLSRKIPNSIIKCKYLSNAYYFFQMYIILRATEYKRKL